MYLSSTSNLPQHQVQTELQNSQPQWICVYEVSDLVCGRDKLKDTNLTKMPNYRWGKKKKLRGKEYLFSGKASVKLLITTIETGPSADLRMRGNYVSSTLKQLDVEVTCIFMQQ